MLRIPAHFVVPLLAVALCGCMLGKPAPDEGGGAPGIRKVEIPPLPKGQVRLYGVLESEGVYFCGDAPELMNPPTRRGLDWGTIPFGADGEGSWFYADVDAATGAVVAARLYFSGSVRDVHLRYGDLTGRIKGSYGTVDGKGFTFTVQGTEFSTMASVSSGVDDEPVPDVPEHAVAEGKESAVIHGKGDLLAAPDGATFAVDMYMGVDALAPGRTYTPEDCDVGTIAHGQARVMRR